MGKVGGAENASGGMNRRFVLRSAAMVSVASGLAACTTGGMVEPRSARSRGSGFDYRDPLSNVRAMARLAGDLTPNGIGRVHYSGRAFAIVPGEPVRPLYGIEGLGSTRIEPVENNQYRFLFSEFAIYTDLATGRPLDSFANPMTRETVPVWHQRNGPINFALRPEMNAFGAFDAVDQQPAFRLPWVVDGDTASFALDVTSARRNPLPPARWPRESSGEMMHLSEHSQYFVAASELADPGQTSLSFHAALQSNKPWHPWMLMGQRPGYVFTRMTARKVAGLDALPAPVAAYARANLNDWLEPPASWTGSYRSAHAIYAETMTPKAPN